jgi:magnesium chelatase family protein
LLLDELPEFNRAALEALRQPLEDKVITLARTHETITFPADAQLVATANPCPCGYYGSNKTCQCTGGEIHRYQQRLSGPILDRIDLYIEVDEVQHDQLLTAQPAETSKHIAQRVQRARDIQQKRYGSVIKCNAHLNNQQVKDLAALLPTAQIFLNQAATQLGLSARSYMRVIKVARTIADLSGAAEISPEHVSEALQYRRRDKE